LQRLPGYTRATLEAEDAALVDDWLTILAAEAFVAKEREKQTSLRSKRRG
jgi:hypothetical protein